MNEQTNEDTHTTCENEELLNSISKFRNSLIPLFVWIGIYRLVMYFKLPEIPPMNEGVLLFPGFRYFKYYF